jgi:ribosomal protein L31
MENRFTITVTDKRSFRVQIGSGTHPEFYTVGTEGHLTEGKENKT